MAGPSEPSSLSEVLTAAADMLSGAAAMYGEPADFLANLGYVESSDGADGVIAHRVALLRAGARFTRLFSLRAPDAPGLIALGAEVDPACVGAPDAPLGSVSGTGVTFRQAFESCVGEGVEFLSQFISPHDTLKPLLVGDAVADGTPAVRDLWELLLPYRRHPGRATADWAIAAALADGGPVRLPADICFRRPTDQRDLDPPWPLSTGCGAAADHLLATTHGLFELIERDAVALWWRGGQRARVPAGDAGAAMLARLRGGETRRRSWVLDITGELGVPVAVAASCDDDGFSVCCGFAARPTFSQAADAALREMAQMELAWRLSVAKRAERGEAALHAVDRRHLRRVTQIDVARTPALQPLAPPLPNRDMIAADSRAVLAETRLRLASAGLAPCAVNLTRPTFGIPVVRVLCPGLEPGLDSPPGPRLLAACAASGADPRAETVPL